MISYSVYKVIHLSGVLMVFLALGAIAAKSMVSANSLGDFRRSIAVTHGIGLVLSLVGGFGLLARLGVAHGGLPGWAYAKLAIWVALAACIGILPRKPNLARPLWFTIIFLGILAAYIAGSKPF